MMRAVTLLGLTVLTAACTTVTTPQASPDAPMRPATATATAATRAPVTASPSTGRTVVTAAITQTLLIADGRPNNRAPAYFEGSRLLATVPVAGGTRPRSIWFTPTSTRLSLEAFGGCNSDADTTPTLSFRVLVNDHVALTDRCARDTGDTTGPAAGGWSGAPTNVWATSLGVRAGQRAKLTVQYLQPTGHAVGAFAVYQQVTPADYQFPPAPAHLALPPANSRGVLLDARHTGANGTFTLVARVGQRLRLTTAAPGQLTIGCGSHQIFGVISWYYKPYTMDVDVSPHGLGATCPPPGRTTIELTVVACRFVRPGWTITDNSGIPLVPAGPTS